VQPIGLTRRSGSMAVFIGVLMVCSTIEASSCIVLTSPYSYSEEQECVAGLVQSMEYLQSLVKPSVMHGNCVSKVPEGEPV
jgi:hypothetical protein